VKIMVQLLEALEYSHVRGVVHRDIKPSNIMITNEGQVKIADFGIAKIESSDLTQVGTVLGTPTYMSPEQFKGLVADRRSDIYSAGLILYQFLAGERPFTGSNMTIIMNKVLNEAPTPLGKLNSDLPSVMQKVVEKAIAKQPEDRFQTAAEFMRALKAAAESSACPVQASSYDATLKIPHPAQNSLMSAAGESATIDFNAVDFEARLQEVQREADLKSSTGQREEQSDNSLREIDLEFRRLTSFQESETQKTVATPPVSNPAVLPASSGKSGESGLLAGLALEAKKKQGAMQSVSQESQARAKRVDDALSRIVNFFNPFVRHVNDVEPTINRTYRYDARTVFSDLKWQGAVIDFRKLSLSEAAFMDYVTISVNLCAPEPVQFKRPWGAIETLKKELYQLRLRVIEDKETTNKKPKQEWLDAQLAPDFPMQIRFQGNYNENRIDVMCRNVGAFGVAAYKLAPDDADAAFLDSLGLYLLGRSDKLPAQLQRI